MENILVLAVKCCYNAALQQHLTNGNEIIFSIPDHFTNVNSESFFRVESDAEVSDSCSVAEGALNEIKNLN